MNNTFSIKRFSFVLKKDLLENGKRYLLYFLTITGIMALIITWCAYDYMRYSGPREISVLYLNRDLLIYTAFCFMGFGLLFSSVAMDPMRSKTDRISYLILPASGFEKYFSRWLIVTIGYIIAFFLALWIADLIRITVCSARFPELEIKALNLDYLIEPSDASWEMRREYLIPNEGFRICISIYFLFQSLFLLGSTYWQKLSFVKTFAVCGTIITAFILLCRWTILSFYNNDMKAFLNVTNSFGENSGLNNEQALGVIICTCALFTLGNWVISYFRFQESEIIRRF
jgi:hypothetical protein